jgi:hypothetical protein
MSAEFRNGFHRICGLRHEKHIWLRTDDRPQTLTENRMVLNA